jgi:hypothetical protein
MTQLLSEKTRKIEKEWLFLLHKLSVLCNSVRENITLETWRDVPRLITDKFGDA